MGAWRHTSQHGHRHKPTHHAHHHRHVLREGVGILDLHLGGSFTVATHCMNLSLPLHVPVPLDKLSLALNSITELLMHAGDAEGAATWEAMQKMVAAAEEKSDSSSESASPKSSTSMAGTDSTEEPSPQTSDVDADCTPRLATESWKRQQSRESEISLRKRFDALEVEHAARNALITELGQERGMLSSELATLSAENLSLKRKVKEMKPTLKDDLIAVIIGHHTTEEDDDKVSETNKVSSAALTELQKECADLKRRCSESEQQILSLTEVETGLRRELDAAKGQPARGSLRFRHAVSMDHTSHCHAHRQAWPFASAVKIESDRSLPTILGQDFARGRGKHVV